MIETFTLYGYTETLYQLNTPSEPMSNDKDVVHLTPESYVRILGLVVSATEKLYEHQQAEIEAWRNDEPARKAELEAYLEDRYLRAYGSGYACYVEEIRDANNAPSTFWEKVGLKKRVLRQDEFGSKRAFADNELKKSGYTNYFIDGIPEDEAGKPWELLDRWVYRYNRMKNQHDVESAKKELSRVREGGPNVKFTISRHRYDMMLAAIEKSRNLEVKESV